jgi:hypothetical protein
MASPAGRDPGLAADHAVAELVDHEQLLGQPVPADDAGDIRRCPVDGGGGGAAELPPGNLPRAHAELRVEGHADVGLTQVPLPVAQLVDEVGITGWPGVAKGRATCSSRRPTTSGGPAPSASRFCMP